MGVTGEPGDGVVLPTPTLEPLPPPMVALPTDPPPPTVPLPLIEPPPTWALAIAVEKASAEMAANVMRLKEVRLKEVRLKEVRLKDMGLPFLGNICGPTVNRRTCFPLAAK
ncbi:hypothetical protein JYU29_01170 [Tianweitania sp. BSSL-BM11]|uniref:Uncharacterized protein n=1 Tax=Tianweitania aestuarii TaxID=2814886 RepID=A0ABS5RSU0_9HYPH|nr:hypothetical protein [Tianweitania aestuarii]MBS9719294.1 hypothetical protein [Tianweitania aestuarii]